MLSSKTLYSKHFSEFRLSESQMEILHKELLDMFLDFKYVCDKYNINYMYLLIEPFFAIWEEYISI